MYINKKVKPFLSAIYNLVWGGSAQNNGGIQLKLKTEDIIKKSHLRWR
jgi:hypothetical protein